MALGLVLLLAISALVTNAAAVQGRVQTTVVFSGYTWDVKSTGWLMGPGPNLWSDDLSNVRVDESGALRLALTQEGDEWYCSEVSLQRSLGYGRYVFTVSSRVDLLEPGVMGALFIYEDDAHEIDIEFTGAREAQYVVQPHYERGNLRSFDLDLEGDFTTHVIDWSPDRIVFSSYHGHFLDVPEEGLPIARWIYTGDDFPRAGEERLHINLWFRDGAAPSGPEEMVVNGFQFIPPRTARRGHLFPRTNLWMSPSLTRPMQEVEGAASLGAAEILGADAEGLPRVLGLTDISNKKRLVGELPRLEDVEGCPEGCDPDAHHHRELVHEHPAVLEDAPCAQVVEEGEVLEVAQVPEAS